MRAWHEAWWEAGGPLTQAGSGHMGEVVAVEAFFQLEQQLQFTEGLPQVAWQGYSSQRAGREGSMVVW